MLSLFFLILYYYYFFFIFLDNNTVFPLIKTFFYIFAPRCCSKITLTVIKKVELPQVICVNAKSINVLYISLLLQQFTAIFKKKKFRQKPRKVMFICCIILKNEDFYDFLLLKWTKRLPHLSKCYLYLLQCQNFKVQSYLFNN